MTREELENLRLPGEVVDIIVEASDGMDVPAQLPIDSYWDHCHLRTQFGRDYLVVPQNTAGSDDYHESRLVGKHNVRKIFGCDIDEFVATVSIYEKTDPDQPAFFVIEESWNGFDQDHYPFRIVVW